MRKVRREPRRLLWRLWGAPTRWRHPASRRLHAWHQRAHRFPALLHPDYGLDRVHRGAGIGSLSRRRPGALARLPGPVPVRGMAAGRLGSGPHVRLRFWRAAVPPGLSRLDESRDFRRLDFHDHQDLAGRDVQAADPGRPGGKIGLRTTLETMPNPGDLAEKSGL